MAIIRLMDKIINVKRDDDMKYSNQQIKDMANDFLQRLLNNEYKCESLPNSSELYFEDKEDNRNLHNAKNVRTDSQLFRIIYEDDK